jgi:hypothetical protein
MLWEDVVDSIISRARQNSRAVGGCSKYGVVSRQGMVHGRTHSASQYLRERIIHPRPVRSRKIVAHRPHLWCRHESASDRCIIA